MADPGPEPSRVWRLLALCGAAVFLAVVAAGAALLAWNLAASAARRPPCPELGTNATLPPWNPPGDPPRDPPEVEELRRQLTEAVQRQEALAGQLDQAESVRQALEEALRACEGRQSRLQTQLKTLKTEMDEARAQGTQMGEENGALTEALTHWEAAATEAAQRLEEAQQRIRAAEAEGGACAAREAALRERVNVLETEMGHQRRESRPQPRSRSRSRSRTRPRPSPGSRPRTGSSGGCRRPARPTIYLNNQRYMAAIILSEQQCQENLKETNKSCNALLLMLGQKAKTLEAELQKEKTVCIKDKEALVLSKRVVEEQLAECGKAQARVEQERRISEERLRKVEALCLVFNKEKFEIDLRNLWRDSIIPRTLDTLGYSPYHPISAEVASIRRSCDHMPTLMSTKVAELAHSLRVDIERVTRENADLQQQKLQAELSLQSIQEAKAKVEKEAQAREAKLQADCARQTQLALEEKAALRKERDSLIKELEEKKKEVEQFRMQLAIGNSALDTCIKAKSQPPISWNLPKHIAPASNSQIIDPASLEEFKKKILASQRPPGSNVAVPPRNLCQAYEGEGLSADSSNELEVGVGESGGTGAGSATLRTGQSAGTKERYFLDAEARVRVSRCRKHSAGALPGQPASQTLTPLTHSWEPSQLWASGHLDTLPH
ncbi:PREDICTED: rootletin-like [Chrysochloris asiatica]|uniref:Rootletin-like n=1 Tax=Chrysochloris asiatica TaxID=185453 RepID=A0A9B0X0R7_CHRAS|nr:PREDICTED: rootletin-like [Chrysochloris asiatica]